MVNRYAGEIHINPVRILRNDDFNNDGVIKDIKATLSDVLELNKRISERVNRLMAWLAANPSRSGQFHFAEGGYISVTGLSDDQLLELSRKGMIELFDFATDKDWVKKYGAKFGLIWENGRAVSVN